jgi:hypothetical protein
MKLDYPQKENGMYYIKRTELDVIARDILAEYAPDVLKKPQPLKIAVLAEEGLGLTLKYQNLSPSGEISGLVSFGDTEFDCYDSTFRPIRLHIPDGTILIDTSLSSYRHYQRRRYTISHEVSHRFLHRSYRSPSNQQYHFRKQRSPMIACRSSNVERAYSGKNVGTDHDWEEWQADGLAGSLLMPLSTFTVAASQIIRARTGRNYIPQNIPKDVRSEIIKRISGVFVVSFRATEVRLRQLNLMSHDIGA